MIAAQVEPTLEIARLSDRTDLGVAAVGLAVWLGLFIVQGRGIAFDASWLLLLVVALGGRALLTRLRFSDGVLEISLVKGFSTSKACGQ